MGVQVAKDAIDLGIVTTNGPAMLAFYRDVLGFVHEGDIAMEHVGIKVMHRLWFGKSLIKLVVPVRDPGAPPAPGGIPGGTGSRYWTMTVHNLDDLHLHLPEMHKGIAPAAGHGTTAPHRATTGVLSPEPVLEPIDGFVQVVYQVSNVLNLVKHHLSFACIVSDATGRYIE
jgi:hypothetical protein